MKKVILALLFLVFIIGGGIYAIQMQEATNNAQKNAAVGSMNAGLSVKVAPGDLLSFSVNILNSGDGKKTDVSITYLIASEKDVEIYKLTETIAVETTNNFVKTVQIPSNTAPGIYTAKISMVYQGQQAPALTQFSFQVEKKIFGLNQNVFFLYGVGTLFLSMLIVVIGFYFVERLTPLEITPTEAN